MVGKNVLVVAHGNSLRSLMMYLEKLTPEQILSKELATGVLVILTGKIVEEMNADADFPAQVAEVR